MMRPRLDLACKGMGLMVEQVGWSFAGDQVGKWPFRDLDEPREAPKLSFYVLRAWEVLPASEVASAVSIDIDGTWHLRNIAGCLVDTSAYEQTEAWVLGDAVTHSMGILERVPMVVNFLRALEPHITDGMLAHRYGVSPVLLRLSRKLAGDSKQTKGKGADDGLSKLVDALSKAGTREKRVAVLKEAIMDVRVGTKDLVRACKHRGVEIEDLEGIIDEAMTVLDRF